MIPADKPQRRMCGLILAGGRARRFGQDKRFAALGAAALIDHAIARMKPQVDALILSSNDPVPGWDTLRHISDKYADQGPLIGIAGGLQYAADQGFNWLITAPADTPFYPQDLAHRLLEGAGVDQQAAAMPQIGFAACGGQVHPVFGAWPTALAGALQNLIDGGERKIDRAAQALAKIYRVQWASDPKFGDPFFNINHQHELAQAQQRYTAAHR